MVKYFLIHILNTIQNVFVDNCLLNESMYLMIKCCILLKMFSCMECCSSIPQNHGLPIPIHEHRIYGYCIKMASILLFELSNLSLQVLILENFGFISSYLIK